MAIMDRVRRGEHDLTGIPARCAHLLAEALDPEPADRPTPGRVRAGCGRWRPAARAVRPHRRAPGPCRRPSPPPPGPAPAPAPHRLWPGSPTPPRTGTPMRDRAPDGESSGPSTAPPAEPRRRPGCRCERARRGVLLLVVAAAGRPRCRGVALGGPRRWSLVAVWLVRSGSLAASAAGDRRRVRGRRWYDGPLLLVRAPGTSCARCPAPRCWCCGAPGSPSRRRCSATPPPRGVALGVGGSVFAPSVWTGPGGSRVRSPWPASSTRSRASGAVAPGRRSCCWCSRRVWVPWLRPRGPRGRRARTVRSADRSPDSARLAWHDGARNERLSRDHHFLARRPRRRAHLSYPERFFVAPS